MLKEAQAQLTTVRDLIRYGVTSLKTAGVSFGHGTLNAYDESVYLVLYTLKLPLEVLEPFLDARVLTSEVNTVLHMIQRRVEMRVPAAYLTHEAWLAGYRFYVDQRVIVPRSFIAELLKQQVSTWIGEASSTKKILELCTGSACLAIIAAESFDSATVDAVDISKDALAVARQNIQTYGLENRVTLHEGDLFEPLPRGRYDLIIANPPYVPDASMERLPQEFRHEPRIALAGGADGLDIVKRILRQARSWLNREGVLIIEVGHERKAVEAAFPDLSLTWISTSGGDDSVFLVQQDHLP